MTLPDGAFGNILNVMLPTLNAYGIKCIGFKLCKSERLVEKKAVVFEVPRPDERSDGRRNDRNA